MSKANGPENRRRPSAESDGMFLERMAKSFQANVVRAGPAASASYALMGALLVFGGMGYAVDRWLGTRWFLLVGLLLGLIVGFYELAKTVWRR